MFRVTYPITFETRRWEATFRGHLLRLARRLRRLPAVLCPHGPPCHTFTPDHGHHGWYANVSLNLTQAVLSDSSPCSRALVMQSFKSEVLCPLHLAGYVVIGVRAISYSRAQKEANEARASTLVAHTARMSYEKTLRYGEHAQAERANSLSGLGGLPCAQPCHVHPATP